MRSQTWWSFVFPNIGFIIAIIDLGTAIDSQVVLWISSVATVLQVIMWLLVFVAHARAVVRKQILWPGKGMSSPEWKQTFSAPNTWLAIQPSVLEKQC